MDTAPHGHSGAAAFHPRGTGAAPGARTCHRHADRDARSHCVTCMAGLCSACVVLEPEGAFCASCRASSRAERHGQLVMVAWMGALAAAGAVVLVMNARPTPGVGERAEARARVVQKAEEERLLVDGVDYGKDAYAAAATWKRLKANPCSVDAAYGLAALQARAGRFEDALATLETVASCEGVEELPVQRARVFRMQGRPDAALQALAEHLDAHPSCVEALEDRTQVLLEQHRPTDARASAETWMDVDPLSETAARALAEASSADPCAAYRAELHRRMVRMERGGPSVNGQPDPALAACDVLEAQFHWTAEDTSPVTAGRGARALTVTVDPALARTVLSRRAAQRLAPRPAQGTTRLLSDGEDDPVLHRPVLLSIPALGKAGTPPWWAPFQVTAWVALDGHDEMEGLEEADVVLGRDVLARLPLVSANGADFHADITAWREGLQAPGTGEGHAALPPR